MTELRRIRPTAEDLEAAALEVLKPDGWCQGRFGATVLDEGAVCAEGAIIRVIRRRFDFWVLSYWISMTDAQEACGLGYWGPTLADYNDTACDTPEAVAALLRRGATTLRARALSDDLRRWAR